MNGFAFMLENDEGEQLTYIIPHKWEICRESGLSLMVPDLSNLDDETRLAYMAMCDGRLQDEMRQASERSFGA